ncbi:hypothetical protein EMIT0P74_30371 [Pseudomonas sp. IT-P74]
MTEATWAELSGAKSILRSKSYTKLPKAWNVAQQTYYLRKYLKDHIRQHNT